MAVLVPISQAEEGKGAEGSLLSTTWNKLME